MKLPKTLEQLAQIEATFMQKRAKVLVQKVDTFSISKPKGVKKWIR